MILDKHVLSTCILFEGVYLVLGWGGYAFSYNAIRPGHGWECSFPYVARQDLLSVQLATLVYVGDVGCQGRFVSRDVSDIGVSCMNVTAKAFVQTWGLLNECNASDHTLIKVVLVKRSVTMNVDPALASIRWKTRWCNWVEYVFWMEELSRRPSLFELMPLLVDKQVEMINGWIRIVNDDMPRKHEQRAKKHAIWWRNAFRNKLRKIHRLRKRFPNFKTYVIEVILWLTLTNLDSFRGVVYRIIPSWWGSQIRRLAAFRQRAYWLYRH